MANINQEFIELRRQAICRYFSALNAEQKEAALTIKGPVLVLAGAGSGKTTVLTKRVENIVLFGEGYESTLVPVGDVTKMNDTLRKYLVGDFDDDPVALQEVYNLCEVYAPKPNNILAITFTKKAANEMKMRLCNILGVEVVKKLSVSTFHSACLGFLRENCKRIGYPKYFEIIPANQQIVLIKKILDDFYMDQDQYDAKALIEFFGKLKGKLITPEAFRSRAETYDGGGNDRWNMVQVGDVYAEIQKRKAELNVMDFDDLIEKTYELFDQNPDVLDKYRQQYKYVMIDEYQDTDFAQHAVVMQLTNDDQNIFVVGDDDQSIYSFRGASVQNILNFSSEFENTRTFCLGQNYRSTKNIVSGAASLICKNSMRKIKKLWTDESDGEKIMQKRFKTDSDEEDFITDFITHDVLNNQAKYSDFAILFRTYALSMSLERELVKANIPYDIVGTVDFFERTEIQDVMAYCKIVSNPNDIISLKRIVNKPARRISKVMFEKLCAVAEREHKTAYELMATANEFPELQESAAAFNRFYHMVETWRKFNQEHPGDIMGLYDMILNDSGYTKMLQSKNHQKAVEQLENVMQVRSNILTYSTDALYPNLAHWLSENELVRDKNTGGSEENRVKLMTIHASKGLEFDTVFVVGMEQGIFPRTYEGSQQEERRLCYVAMTRAKRRLFMLSSIKRTLFGKTRRNKPSCYITEIAEEYVDRDACMQMETQTYQTQESTQNSKTYQNEETENNITEEVPTVAVGNHVKHKIFGEGIVTKTLDGCVVANFEGIDRSLLYPYAFAKKMVSLIE